MNLWTPKELAEYLKLPGKNPVTTLAKWRSAQRGPAYLKHNGLIRYEQSAVEAWLQSCTVQRPHVESPPKKASSRDVPRFSVGRQDLDGFDRLKGRRTHAQRLQEIQEKMRERNSR